MVDWTVSWANWYPGVDYAGAHNQGGSAANVHILRIDLTNPQIELFTTPRASMNSNGVKTTDFLQANFDPKTMLAMLAVNANFFDMDDRTVVYGLLLSQGDLVSFPYSAGSPFALVVTKGNLAGTSDTPAVFDTFATQDPSDPPWTGVAGNLYLVRGGQPVNNQNTGPVVAARTAVGLSEPNSNGVPQYLFLLAIDGIESQDSNPPYYGATHLDTAKWLIAAGAYEGLNLDGGGSTTMGNINQSFPYAGTVNTPHCDDTQEICERAVAAAFAVIVRPSK